MNQLYITIVLNTYKAISSYLGTFSIPDESLNWTFSTIAQSMIALIAFMGIFVVYRIQIINQEKTRVFEAIVNKLRLRDIEIDGLTNKLVIEKLDEEIKGIKERNDKTNDILINIHSQYFKLVKNDKKVKRRFFYFFIPTVIAIIVSLFSLPFITFLTSFAKLILLITTFFVILFSLFLLTFLLIVLIFDSNYN